MKLLRQSVVILLCGLTGCTTLMVEGRNQAAREREESDAQRETVTRLEARVEGLLEAQEDLNRRLADVHASHQKESDALRNEIAELKQSVRATAAARQKLKADLVHELSQKMAVIMQSQEPPAPGVEHGRWHTVEKGQTLSQIAGAYSVTTSAIVRANDSLKNENTIIKIGQRLFIPE